MIRSSSGGRRRLSSGVRLGVAVLAISAAYPGLWALISPRSFFYNFPGLGLDWVASMRPYNEHLVRDAGSFYLAFAVLLGAAALTGDRRLIRVSLLSWLVFSVTHVVWHAQNVMGDGTVQRWGPAVSLGLGILLSVSLLLALRRR